MSARHYFTDLDISFVYRHVRNMDIEHPNRCKENFPIFATLLFRQFLSTKLVDSDEVHPDLMTRQLVTMPFRTERYNHCPGINVQTSLFLIDYPLQVHTSTKALFGSRV